MSKATILVVDDEALIRWSLTRAPRVGRLRRPRSRYRASRAREAPRRRRPRSPRLPAARHRRRRGTAQDEGVRSGHPGDPAHGLRQRRNRRRGDEARGVPLRQQAVQPGRRRGDGRTRTRDDPAAARGAAVPVERGQAVQPAAHRRGLGGRSPALRHMVARVAVSPASTILITGPKRHGQGARGQAIHYDEPRGAARSWRSTARLCRNCSRASSSATSAARSPRA